MNISPAVGRRILWVLVGIVGLILWVCFFLIPQWRISSEVGPRVRTLRKQLSQARQRISHGNELEARMQQATTEHQLPSVIPPLEEQVPELLERIAQAALKSEVHLLMVKPQEDYNQLAPGPSGYLELPVRIEASAGYHQIGQFIDTLENSENLVRLYDVRIQSDAADIWRHHTMLTLLTYLLLGGESANKEKGR